MTANPRTSDPDTVAPLHPVRLAVPLVVHLTAHHPTTKPFRVRSDRPHLVLVQGGRAHLPAPFVVAPPAVRAVLAAAAPSGSDRVVRMQEADLIRCRSLRSIAR